MKKQAALFILILSAMVLPLPAKRTGDNEASRPSLAFVTYVSAPYQENAAAMLIDSIRAHGGAYRDCPVYVVLTDEDNAPGTRLPRANVEILPLRLEVLIQGYPFAVKAYAAAKVEELTAGKFHSLAWFDPETLLLNPPKEMDLSEGIAAAVNPVTLTNTGQKESEPINAYWAAIYKACSLDPQKLFAVETGVDCNKIRAWLNCGIFAVRPERGLCREWAKILDALIHDPEFQHVHIQDALHKTFLHQAVISTLIVSRLERSEIHLFSPGNGYPLFCHNIDFQTSYGSFRVPDHKMAKRLNDLTSVFHESFWFSHPDWLKSIPPADAPLKEWLNDRFINRILKVADRIFREENSCNSYLVTTTKGSVLIDPGGARAPESWLRKIAKSSPLKAILLTHAHEDHRSGIASWKNGANIHVIGQAEMVEFIRYHDRLHDFLSRRQAIQAGTPLAKTDAPKAETPIEATKLFADRYRFALDGLHFELIHTGGETPDHCLLWIPELKAAFIGDNYYISFPNLYTLRGTKPRWTLDYIKALEKALSLEPEILLPGHDEPVLGKGLIRRKLSEYRDAIRYVHDEVVKGMNQGKDVFTLMREIKLPPASKVGQFYGRVSWSVRGIFEGYAGWFDENPANMYEQPPASVYREIAGLCGSAALVAKAGELLKNGNEVGVLHLTDVALAAAADNQAALEIRLQALKQLRAKSRNGIERNWLTYGIGQAEQQLKKIPETK
jgi:glyoxylase-like metal-dependent hydrolase (beta-lactamase superfamily II)